MKFSKKIKATNKEVQNVLELHDLIQKKVSVLFCKEEKHCVGKYESSDQDKDLSVCTHLHVSTSRKTADNTLTSSHLQS